MDKVCPRCNILIKDHPANACLDALFGELVMEWELKEITFHSGCGSQKGRDWFDKQGQRRYMNGYFNPSTNISHAMEGGEKHREQIALRIRVDYSEAWCDLGERKYDVYEFHTYSKGALQSINQLIALAICRALILWAMERQGEH